MTTLSRTLFGNDLFNAVVRDLKTLDDTCLSTSSDVAYYYDETSLGRMMKTLPASAARWVSSQDAAELHVMLPGVSKEELNVNMTSDGHVEIRAEVDRESVSPLSKSDVDLRVYVGSMVNSESDPSASLKDGILVLSWEDVPKRTRRIEIG